MNTVEKIKDTISRLEELNNDINIVLDPSYLINTKADLANIEQQINLAKSNNEQSVNKLIKVKGQLESRLEHIKDTSSLHSVLVMRMDEFMIQQRNHLPRFELKSNKSVLDRIHPFYNRTNLSKCHKDLSTFFNDISISDKVELINDILKLTGRKKVYINEEEIVSTSCAALGDILNAVFHKKGFYMVKMAIDYSGHQGDLSPAELLTFIIQYYNRRTTSTSIINHQYE